MAEDELFDLSLENFQSMADRVSSEYGRFSGRLIFISLAISVCIVLLCAMMLFGVALCKSPNRGFGFGNSNNRKTVGTDEDSLKYLRSV